MSTGQKSGFPHAADVKPPISLHLALHRYCSKECQTADWAKHKEICGKNSAHAAALNSFHALTLPRDITRTATHVLRLFVQLRTDHKGSPAKYFRILEAKVESIEDAKTFPDPWQESLRDLQNMRGDSEKMGRGTIAAIGVECPPLGVQMIPCGSLKRSSLSSVQLLPNWKDILTKDIEEGKKFQRFGY
ncbi:hypothetical protein SERLADRAFT_458205 [Serpula lacrymans var. lacrymans S7.9]|uniref:MYND-type domain-containing protein n=1 Tax=Serpula lacrymans var. lacrymans (strain S7.9) TaxID=578457 RepID=F8NH12_SERL9|nr:uncharacterized protein SERLADRAFT_458205 [Serpula lacrymans var. lacrymans S7.9]EGO29869.1 hypothetical protein SERLADRAFT_458205 [Serpula lacrymans var. lacrymans S7.9]